MIHILLNILWAWSALDALAAFYFWLLARKRAQRDRWQHLHPGLSPDWRRQW